MSATAAVDPRYPLGRYQVPDLITSEQREGWIGEIANLPVNLKRTVAGLSEAQLETPYRLGGWTVRQVVHHLPDSHINSYVRFRWALTEPSPIIKTYEEARWAELADAKSAPIAPSLALLDALHARWEFLLNALTDADFARTLKHPELGEIRLDWMLGLYAWHGRHHVAQIQRLCERSGW
jgi:hypothetical protein